MDDMQKKIETLKALQQETRWCRTGGVITILVVIGLCLWHVREHTLALVNEGATHDQFMAQLKTGLVRDAVPEARKIGVKTLDRLGPVLQKELVKIELRVPEFTRRAEEQMSLLREHLPERAQKALQPSLGVALDHEMTKWKKQYPNLTPDQLTEASQRLTKEIDERMANVAAAVILPYDNSLEQMVGDLAEIRKLEKGHDEIDSWDLAVVSLGLLHEELVKIDPHTRQMFVASLDKKEIK